MCVVYYPENIISILDAQLYGTSFIKLKNHSSQESYHYSLSYVLTVRILFHLISIVHHILTIFIDLT